jgi:hypothetical protein
MSIATGRTDVPPPAGDPAPDDPKAARVGPQRRSAFGGLLVRLHFYAGILIAPFLLVAALTGLLYTITPQIDAVLYGGQLTATHHGGSVQPLTAQITAARAAHPTGTLAAIQPGTGDQTTKVVFSLPELGEKQHTVYVLRQPLHRTRAGHTDHLVGIDPGHHLAR